MACLTLITAGPYTSIQDKGRTGFQALGVPEGGAVDPDARISANWLVGQPADAAGLEIFIGGLSFHTDTALAVALAGSLSDSLQITSVSGQTRNEAAGQTVYLQAGDHVTIPPLRGSNLVFLAVSARFDLAPVFGSVGISANAKIGGLNGDMLKTGDKLALTEIKTTPAERQLPSSLADIFTPEEVFRIVLGPQDFCFDSGQIDMLVSTGWTLTTRMNRMGLRLSGPALHHKISADILSDGIVKGAIQVPGDGQPIILMADHQTTGGYTKIATVISADLAKLTRLHPHRTVRFTVVSQEEAEQIANAKARLLRKNLAD